MKGSLAPAVSGRGWLTMAQERNRRALHRAPPKEITDCLKDLNPYYATHLRAYTENCQRCVVAYEVRRRGYPVFAKPYIGGKADPLPYMNAPDGWPAVFREKIVANCSARTAKKVQETIEWQMRLFGDRSRAVVKVSWKQRGTGHLFMVENIDDAIYFVDPQTGDDDVGWYFPYIDPNRVMILRTDCVQLTGLVWRCCDP